MKLEFNEENNRKLMFGGLAAALCICIFFAYRALYTAGVSDYAKEFTAGCIGAVITIFATAALLRSQNENEVTKDQLAGIFKEKLELYKSFIHFLNAINHDGEIDSLEIREAVEWGGKLSLVCRPSVIRALHDYIFQIVAFGSDCFDELDEIQKISWRNWVCSRYDGAEKELGDDDCCREFYSSRAGIIGMLRDDLSHKKMSHFDENLEMEIVLDELFSLHSVVDIKFLADGSIEIGKVFQPTPKKKPRREKPAA